jgi:soluble P-type ATPase
MNFEIPGVGDLTIDSLILDLNGTVAIDGIVVDGVSERIADLRSRGLKIFLFSGDTQGNAADIASELEVDLRKTPSADQKVEAVREIGVDTAATIGNGRIDKELFEEVRLAIATLQAEGVHIETLLAADLVVPSINDALDLLLKEKRLIASLRK